MRFWFLVSTLLTAAAIAPGKSPPQDQISKLTANDLAGEKKIFIAQCALCHGIGGTGGRGPIDSGTLVFGGSDEGNFYALDAMTGKPLWDFQTGGRMAANPISFLIDGKQHVAMAAGHSLFVFGL